jgi:hypothetical protein
VQSRLGRAVVAIASIGAAVVLFIVLEGGDEKKSAPPAKTAQKSHGRTTQAPAEPAPVTITVQNAKPVGGIKRLEYVSGERVRLRVRSDVADEVHIHGYDLSRDVRAGGTVSFSFPAKLEGVFEIELESRKEQIAELRVKPR